MNKKSYITPTTMVELVKTRIALMQASVYFYRDKETTDNVEQLSRRGGSVWHDEDEDEYY